MFPVSTATSFAADQKVIMLPDLVPAAARRPYRDNWAATLQK